MTLYLLVFLGGILTGFVAALMMIAWVIETRPTEKE